MNGRTAKTLLWAPRVLLILLTLFISMFALDAFDHAPTIWHGIGAFLIHLVPSYVLIGTLLLAWRRPWIGAVVLAALATALIVFATGRHRQFQVFFLAGPLLLIAALFLANALGSRRSLARPLQ